MVSFNAKATFPTLFAQSSCDYYSHFTEKVYPRFYKKIFMFPILPAAFARMRAFPAAAGLPAGPCAPGWHPRQWSRSPAMGWSGSHPGPAARTAGACPAGSGLQLGGGGVKGQIIGPAKADALLQLHHFLFTQFPDGQCCSPLSATAYAAAGPLMQKAVETAWQIVVY